MESYEILPNGTIIEYKLYEEDGAGEVLRRGPIISFNDRLGKYHVGERVGTKWTTYGFYWVHPEDVRKVITEND